MTPRQIIEQVAAAIASAVGYALLARINGDVQPAALLSLVGLYGEGGVLTGGEG